MFRNNKPLATARWWRHALAGLALAGISALPAFAQTAQPSGTAYVLNKDHSKIQFSISHFVVSSTEGQFTAFDGKLNFEPQAPDHGTVTIHNLPRLYQHRHRRA